MALDPTDHPEQPTSTSRRRRRGASAVEFALIFPFMVVLIFGAIEFSWYISIRYDVQRAAREGARIGSAVLLTPEDTGDLITNAAVQRATDVLEARGNPCGAGCLVTAELFFFGGYQHLQVNVAYPHTPLVPGLELIAPSARGQFVMLTQQQ